MLGKLSDYPTVAKDEAEHYSQEPQFDDTGDGVYNIADDGNRLKEIYINENVTMADINKLNLFICGR